MSLKWFATYVYMLGIVLTSYNQFPLNTYVGCFSAALWTIAGIQDQDRALTVGSFIAVVVYASGWIFH